MRFVLHMVTQCLKLLCGFVFGSLALIWCFTTFVYLAPLTIFSLDVGTTTMIALILFYWVPIVVLIIGWIADEKSYFDGKRIKRWG